MNARLSLSSAGITLVATTLTLALLYWLQSGLSAVEPRALILLELGFPALVAVVSPVVADQTTSPRTSGRRLQRWLIWSFGLSINYWCVCGLFVDSIFGGETIRIGAFWFTWCCLAGAMAGVAFADWYGRRWNVLLPPSRARRFVLMTLGIASSAVSAMIVVPMGVLVFAMCFGAVLTGSAGSK